MSENYFAELCQVNVSAHVEKKGQFTYLSWPFAVQELGKIDPSATWEVRRHNGLPYIETPLGYFVEVSVTCKGVTKSQIHPVLDGANRPIAKPTPFHINTSIQRALVKAIALHGLGLYIYAGEDLPEGEKSERIEEQIISANVTPNAGAGANLTPEEKESVERLAHEVIDCFAAEQPETAYEVIEEAGLSAEQKLFLWSKLDSKQRSALKKIAKAHKEAAFKREEATQA